METRNRGIISAVSLASCMRQPALLRPLHGAIYKPKSEGKTSILIGIVILIARVMLIARVIQIVMLILVEILRVIQIATIRVMLVGI